MLALLPHPCPCGKVYVVSLADEEELERHPDWRTAPGSVAASLGQELVDGRAAGFFCSACSRLHVRAASPLAPAWSLDQDPMLSLSLN